MATDGVKIIDGDLAHDTYEYIMELYDNGASAEIIKKEIPFIPKIRKQSQWQSQLQ